MNKLMERFFGKKVVFKTRDGEVHTIKIFKGKKGHRIKMASGRFGTITKKLNAEKVKSTTSNGDKAIIEEALKKSKDLDDLMGELAGNTEISSDDDKLIDEALEAIADELKGITISDLQMPPTKITWKMDDGKADEVIANPLTITPGNTRGSNTTVDPPAWSYIYANAEKTKRSNKIRFWIKFHLINDEYHGPGKTWNLIPTAQADNVNYGIQFEELIKKAIGQKAGDPTSTKILRVRIKVNYHSASSSELKPEIPNDQKERIPKSLTINWGYLSPPGTSNTPPKGTSDQNPTSFDLPKTTELANNLGDLTEQTYMMMGGQTKAFLRDIFGIPSSMRSTLTKYQGVTSISGLVTQLKSDLVNSGTIINYLQAIRTSLQEEPVIGGITRKRRLLRADEDQAAVQADLQTAIDQVEEEVREAIGQITSTENSVVEGITNTVKKNHSLGQFRRILHRLLASGAKYESFKSRIGRLKKAGSGSDVPSVNLEEIKGIVAQLDAALTEYQNQDDEGSGNED